MNRIFIILLLVMLSFNSAHSQEAVKVSSPYASTKLPDLARVYWKLNQLDTKNDALIDQYLMITECKIHQKYFTDDFEWNKIRKATRDYIDTYRNRFKTQLEFVQPIYLDRYDFDQGGFPILANSKIELLSRLQIAENDANNYPCLNRSYRERDFPPDAALTLPKPFTYKLVKTDQETADKFLEYLKAKRSDTSKGRPAFIRYRINVSKSMPPIMNGNQAMANFFGTIESVTVYADKERTVVMEDQKF